MPRIAADLKQSCHREPQRERNVVITLAAQCEEHLVSDLGLEGVVEIPGLTGVLKGRLAGSRILELSERPEVDEVSEDFEVEI